MVSSGPGSIITAGVIKIVAFIVISPLLGMIFGFIISTIVQYIARNNTPFGVDKHFRRLQLVSAAAFSLGHGGNDAQKSMGIIWVALIVYGITTKDAARSPCGLFYRVSLPLLWEHCFGGWRIVKTMGQKITKLKPFEGFCAETAGALTLFGATHFGIPVSTTHTITGAIIGVGSRKGLSAVKWGVTTKIFWAWIFTIPVSGLIGAVIYYFIQSDQYKFDLKLKTCYMNIDKFLKFFVPKDHSFYPLFEEDAKNLVKATELLKQQMSGTDPDSS